ncbi:MAG: hypothetical protein OXQ94_14860 [Gemmatimonadota bacterium]|nr:hypothetical protein [Gemmatimonadota bacterium]MDE2872956.1 hypothetical protein [Gemmatimonadota bacterium]
MNHETLVHFPKGRRRRLLERRSPGEPVYVSREFGLTAGDDRLKGVEPKRSAVATLALVNVPAAARLAAFLRDTLLGASNIAGNDTFTRNTPAVIGWLEASGEARAWARGQVRRSDLGIEDIEVVDGFGGKHIRFSHRGLDVPVVLGLESRGTRELVHLLPLIRFALDTTGLAILDEIVSHSMIWSPIRAIASGSVMSSSSLDSRSAVDRRGPGSLFD